MTTLARSWLWGWLALAQLCADLVLSLPYLLLLVMLVVGVCLTPFVLVGVPIVAVCLVCARICGELERLRARSLIGVGVPRPAPRERRAWWQRVLFDGRSWRATVHLLLISLWGLLAGALALCMTALGLSLAFLPLYRSDLDSDRLNLSIGLGPGNTPAHGWMVPLGVTISLVTPLVARGLVGVDLMLVRWLLGPSHTEELSVLSERVQTLTVTREATVDSVELERRRIERDLHDGPQQRLVAIAMELGMVRSKLEKDPAAARELLDRAHASSKEAITEMRQVARGIHPPVLTDRGLDAALSALAARSPVPVSVSVFLDRRPSPTIEAIAYFCVSEALTNVAKHSRARSARVQVLRDGTGLLVTVTDDGVGGADPTRGTGLVGLGDRVRAVDGRLEVTSPAGGPTVLTISLPERPAPSRRTS